MNHHPFRISQLDFNICVTCKRRAIDHGAAAICESCGNQGPCEIAGNDMLLCPECWDKQIAATINAANESAERHRQLIADSHMLDAKIIEGTDIYNAATIPYSELYKAVQGDVSIPSADKEYKYHDLLTDRYKFLKARIFNDNKELIVVNNILRSKEQDIRTEIRDKLKEADEQYQPVVKKPIKVAIKKESAKSPLDRVIEALALQNGISKEQAKVIFEQLQSKISKGE